MNAVMVVVPGLRQLSVPDEVTVATEVLEEDQLLAPHAKGPSTTPLQSTSLATIRLWSIRFRTLHDKCLCLADFSG